MAKIQIICFVLLSFFGLAKLDKDWWKHSIVYQIYPRSFQDSNGDGIGDLNGITERLDYVKSLGVDAIWLSPVYVSPMADFGYDIADHKEIEPIFGSDEDMKRLIEQVHARDMYLVMDFVPNHTSDKHRWFESSRRKVPPYDNFYRWHGGKWDEDGTRSPANNWLSIFGGSAWEWDEIRQEYYLHQFLKEQPDLNYREPLVRQEMEDVLRYWIELGVDGFRVDAITTLFEVEDVEQDEPLSGVAGYTLDEHESLRHLLTLHQDEIHEVIREWRNLLDDFEQKTGKHVFMVTEGYSHDIADIIKYYHSGADIPFNFGFIPVNKSCGGFCFRDITQGWMNAMPEDGWPNFVLGNHDNRRITTRKGALYAQALNTMLLLLPGTPTTYMGEEIGQLDIAPLPKEETQDPWGARLGEEFIAKYSRDPCRAPFQWNSDKNAGFSTAFKTWLPVHRGYPSQNVKVQETDPKSTLSKYKAAARLRRKPAFVNKQIQVHIVNGNIFSFYRFDDSLSEAYLIILNLGGSNSVDDYTGTVEETPMASGVVEISNVFEQGEDISLSQLGTAPGDFYVIKLNDDSSNQKQEL